MSTQNLASRPNYKRPEYTDAEPARTMCRDLMASTATIQNAGTKYLPKHPGEDQSDYEVRKKKAEVFRAFARTVEAAVGMIHAVPVTLGKDADATAKQDWEDIDCQGTHGEVLARHLTEDGIVDGFAGILVDYPPIPPGVTLNAREEEELGIRPFWVKILRHQIISWMVEVPNWTELLKAYAAGAITAAAVRAFAKQTVLRQVVIHEPTEQRDGEFGRRVADRYRILTLTAEGVTFRVVEAVTANGMVTDFKEIASGAMTGANRQPLPAIPLAMYYAGRKSGAFVADPPLLPLAELNIGHYQVSADRRYLMSICHAPTLVITGIDDKDENGKPRVFKTGPNRALILPPENAKADWIAASSDALATSKEEKEDLVRQMAAVGMSFLAKDRRGVEETARGREIDDAAENATHATAARGLQDCLEAAWVFHAAYRGITPPSIEVNTSYAASNVDPQIAGLLWQAVLVDRLDMETFLAYVRTGDLPENLDPNAEALLSAAREAARKDRTEPPVPPAEGAAA